MIRNSANEKWREIFIMKTANENRASTTTPTNDTDLQFAMKNGRLYTFDLWAVVFCASATPGFKYTIVAPTHTAVFGWPRDQSTNGTITRTLVTSNSLPANVVTIDPNAALGAFLRLQGQIKPTADGTLAIQWSQNTSNATAVSMTLGSYLKIREIYT